MSVAEMQKRDFLKKLSNVELWCLLTTYRKSYMGRLANRPGMAGIVPELTVSRARLILSWKCEN